MPRTETSDSSDSELVLRFGELEISVRSRAGSVQTHTPSAGSPVTAGSPSVVRGSAYQTPVQTPLAGLRAPAASAAAPATSVAARRAQWESDLLAARTAEDFAALDLQVVEHLLSRLRATSCGLWTPLARLGRAYRAGLVARHCLTGEPLLLNTPPIPLRNTIYIVLRGKPGVEPGWTVNYGTYIRAVAGDHPDRFHPASVSHAFATRTEAEAYVLGAEAVWPPGYQQDR